MLTHLISIVLLQLYVEATMLSGHDRRSSYGTWKTSKRGHTPSLLHSIADSKNQRSGTMLQISATIVEALLEYVQEGKRTGA